MIPTDAPFDVLGRIVGRSINDEKAANITADMRTILEYGDRSFTLKVAEKEMINVLMICNALTFASAN